MIIQCQSCAAKYFLADEKVPANPLKVRCPKCRAVFMLSPRAERVGVAPQPAVQRPPVTFETVPPLVETMRPDPVAAAPEPVRATAAPVLDEAPETEVGRPARGGKTAEDRAKRLARVLVSDILWYNRERRDAALRDGTLMTSLGEEIKKSWELYKEKVGPEAAHSTNYFKEALNEILANGQQVF
jgi:predicted Zn finger-like uncharacterized protein